MIDVQLSCDLQPMVRLGLVACERGPSPAAEQAFVAVLHAAARTAVAETRDTSAARDLYKAIGLDPTRTRPSSEALLRRVRKGEGVPRVNRLVDIGNWCSLDVQLPYGLYDAERIEGPVRLRKGRAGESYPGIRKDDVHLDGRLALFDEAGPFGNPSSDSARTMVTDATVRVLAVVFAPARVDRAAMTRVVEMTAERLTVWADARALELEVR